MMRRVFIILAIAVAFIACREEQINDNPTLKLAFSKDTVAFDTVFTDIGSSTLQFMVYNPNTNALKIERIWQDKAEEFKVNIDGENDLKQMKDWVLYGGDSLFVFVKVRIDPNQQNSPILVEDNLHFAVNGKTQTVHFEAYGQDVRLMRSTRHINVWDNYTFVADKPYLIYDTVAIREQLTFEPGARLYFHDKAVLMAYGSVSAKGTLDKPITLQGDRIDRLFDSVPYSYVAGMWGGMYLFDTEDAPAKEYLFDHVEILAANVGLYCLSEKTSNLPKLNLLNSRIHNHAVYGLVIQDMDADVINCELSNAAAYCAYLAGGTHHFIHTTIASYFNSTNVRIQSVLRDDVAAVYINNISKRVAHSHTSFRNCIVSGIRRNNLLVATPLPDYYSDTISGNYLKADSLKVAAAMNNVYWQKEDTMPLFKNTYYKYKEYKYYDFQLDSLSPARGIGDSAVAAQYPYDRLGRARTKPDAGCYQYE